METKQNEIIKNIQIGSEEFRLVIKIYGSKLRISINSEDSAEQYERELSLNELIEYRAFSLFDSLEEILFALNENINSNNNISFEYNEEKNLVIKFEFLFLSKKINVPLTLIKKTQDIESTMEFMLEEIKKIKRENKGLLRINEELKKDFEKFTSECKSQIEELKNEVEKFTLGEKKKLHYVRFEFSGGYSSQGKLVGTNNLHDLNDTSLNKGICANSPGWISIGFNDLFTFEEIEIGGYSGDPTRWGPNNGRNGKILTSVNILDWTEVGVIPLEFGSSIIKVKLVKSTAKFIKFQHTSYIGLGYLKINAL